jgi:hypothetical protein
MEEADSTKPPVNDVLSLFDPLLNIILHVVAALIVVKYMRTRQARTKDLNQFISLLEDSIVRGDGCFRWIIIYHTCILLLLGFSLSIGSNGHA